MPFPLSKYSLKSLNMAKFSTFIENKKKHLPKRIQDKFWIVKYLILVMIRYNYISVMGEEINNIMNVI